MLLAYVDESYTDDEFYLGVVIVDGDALHSLEARLDALVQEYAEQSLIPAGAELHGYELFHRKGDWSGMPTRLRINVYERTMAAIGSCGAQIVFRGMDVKRQKERYFRPHPPHEVVLGHTLESIEHLAAARREYALIIADEVHSDERHRTNFRNFRQSGTPGYRSSTLPHLVDTIHFAPSKHSRLLQAADLVTFLHRRRRTHPETDDRAKATNERLWGHIRPTIALTSFWTP